MGNACSSMQRHKGHGGLVTVLLSNPIMSWGAGTGLDSIFSPVPSLQVNLSSVMS